MLDVLIKNGMIVDGTNVAPRPGDVGIRDGRIVAIGKISEPAAETVDATGRLVTPGFVDPHTHYDAQLFWDPTAAPSNQHGVTSVIAGNCGFTLAPIRERDADYTRRMMAQVEGMPLWALKDGAPWTWSTFGEYLNALTGNIAVNAAFMVGHCALRRWVLGSDFARASTDSELEQIKELLPESLRAGGLGLSTTRLAGHTDGDGVEAPSFWASEHEVVELARIVGQYEGTSLELTTDGCVSRFSDAEVELMAKMSEVSGRALNWNVLRANLETQVTLRHQLRPSQRARELGGRVVALSLPAIADMNKSFRPYCALWRLPPWPEVLNLEVEERIKQLQDPAVRERLSASAVGSSAAHLANFGSYLIGDVYSAENEQYRNRKVASIAAEQGVDVFTALIDIVSRDKLQTVLWLLPDDDTDGDCEVRRQLWGDPDVMPGGSDAGAHLDRFLGANYPTAFLADTLRGRKLVPLERAIHMMTDTPARFFGLTDRGRIELGYHADLLVLDPETVGSAPVRAMFDLPGEAKRLTADSRGIERVYVNGRLTIIDGQSTGDLPGTVLRSGRDTSHAVGAVA